jgi:Spx/MgsR family transcriptional regulator
MSLTVYGIKNCDSMKKAFQWLDAEAIPYTFIDFKTSPPTADLISTWLEVVGDRLVNTRGPSYRQLPDALKAEFRGQARIDAIVAKPTLIKRPLLVNGQSMTVGFDPTHWAEVPGLLTA